MPSSTETFLCDRFTTEEQGSGGGRLKSMGVPLHSAQTPPPLTPTCASHINSIPKLKHMLPCAGSRIEFLTYPLMIRFTLLFSSLPVTLSPCHRTLLEVTGRTDKGGGGWSEGRQWVKGRRSTFSPQSHEFPWTGQMLPHIFWLHWQVAHCFPW